MAYVTEQMIFDYFTECNRKLTLEDLVERFEDVPHNVILVAVNNLINKRFLTETDNVLAWSLTERAKILIQEDIEKTKHELELKELEYEKTKTDLELAKKMLKEYPATKKMARYGFIIAVIIAIIEVVRILHELNSN